MANSTYRHYRVAQREHDQPDDVVQQIEKAINKPYYWVFIIPCILTFLLGYCLGRYTD